MLHSRELVPADSSTLLNITYMKKKKKSKNLFRVLIIFRHIKVSRNFENTALMQEFPTLLPSRRHGNWSYYKAQRGEQLVYSYRPPHWVSGSLSAGRSVSWSSRNWLQAAGPVWLVNEKLYVRPRFHQPPRLWHLYKENRHALLGTAHWSSGQKKPELKSRCHIQQHLFYPVGRSSLREVTHEHWRVSFETAFMVAWRHGVVAGPAGLFYPFFFFFLMF